MYDELINRLRELHPEEYDDEWEFVYDCQRMTSEAADAIEKLSAKVDSLQLYVDKISELPDCNTCLNNNTCEFRPKLGEYCRINCHAWVERLPKEE